MDRTEIRSLRPARLRWARLRGHGRGSARVHPGSVGISDPRPLDRPPPASTFGGGGLLLAESRLPRRRALPGRPVAPPTRLLGERGCSRRPLLRLVPAGARAAPISGSRRPAGVAGSRGYFLRACRPRHPGAHGPLRGRGARQGDDAPVPQPCADRSDPTIGLEAGDPGFDGGRRPRPRSVRPPALDLGKPRSRRFVLGPRGHARTADPVGPGSCDGLRHVGADRARARRTDSGEVVRDPRAGNRDVAPDLQCGRAEPLSLLCRRFAPSLGLRLARLASSRSGGAGIQADAASSAPALTGTA